MVVDVRAGNLLGLRMEIDWKLTAQGENSMMDVVYTETEDHVRLVTDSIIVAMLETDSWGY